MGFGCFDTLFPGEGGCENHSSRDFLPKRNLWISDIKSNQIDLLQLAVGERALPSLPQCWPRAITSDTAGAASYQSTGSLLLIYLHSILGWEQLQRKIPLLQIGFAFKQVALCPLQY